MADIPPPPPPGPPSSPPPPPPGPPTSPPPPPGPQGDAPPPQPWWRRTWWKLPVWTWITAAVVVLIVIGAALGAGGDETTDDDATIETAAGSSAPEGVETSEPEPTEPAPETTEAVETTEEIATTTPPTTTATPTTTAPPTTVPPTTVPPTTVPPATPPPIPGFGPGIQLVGTDVPPGAYTAPGGGLLCYWERLSGLGGTFEEIITNNAGQGQQIVAIDPTDVAFSSEGCGEWTAFLGAAPVASFGDGDWAVGQHIAPGRWATDGTGDGCYWERASGFGHGFEEIIANEFIEGRAIVEIGPSDVRFSSSDCGVWTPLP